MLLIGSQIVLWITTGYFLWFALMVWRKPLFIQQYLLAFAANRNLHFLELALRLLIAMSCWLVSHSKTSVGVQVALQGVALVLGVSSVVLCVLPWQWHRRFAVRTVPKALCYLPWLGGGACLMAIGLGVVLLTS